MSPRDQLKAWRTENECSVADLADVLGCSRQMVYALESDSFGKVPGLDLAARIEDVTNIPAVEWDRLARIKHQRPRRFA